MNAAIRYLAFVSKTPHKLAHFYCQHLGMHELGRSPEGDISVGDGFYNLTVLLHRDDRAEPGFGQIGIAVDDVKELEDRLRRHAPGAELQPDAGGLHFGEYCVKDPNGYPVAISTTNFGMSQANEAKLPAIVHAAVCEPSGESVAAFFSNVFGFAKTSPRMWGSSGRFVSDGQTNLAVLASAGEMRAQGGHITPDHVKQGLNHFGFEVPSAEQLTAQFPPEAGATQRTDRPRPQGYYRAWDPDGNHFDLRSSPGWRAE